MYRIYWTNEEGEAEFHDYDDLKKTLEFMEYLRQVGRRFVTMCSENPNCTSLTGVDSVKDMILPNGAEYGYVKRRYK